MFEKMMNQSCKWRNGGFVKGFYNKEPAASQYREFLKLEARGALLFFRESKNEHLAVDRLKRIVPDDVLTDVSEWSEPIP